MSEESLDLLVGKVQLEIKKLDADRNDLEDDRKDLKKRLSNLSSSEKSPLLGRISEMNNMELSRIVHEEVERVIVIKGKKRYDYVLGIQYMSGDYVMVDVNARYKRVFENGVEIKTS